MNNKGFLEISFPWMFAIIVGIAILFFTIYGVTKLISTEETIQDVQTSKEIGILLNPLETGFEEAISNSLAFPVNTRVYNIVSDFGDFGKQTIQISQLSFNKWTPTTVDVNFENKYIFSKNPTEGKIMNIFSKSFEFPFKISDLIYITSIEDKYCFNNAPDDVEDELNNLNQENILTENCSAEHINVCFSSGQNCDIKVSYVGKTVEKDGVKMYFESDALMYGAIFSDKNVYELQLKRLMKRLANLAQLYLEKSNFVSVRGCNSGLDTDLTLLISSAQNIKDSSDLSSINDMVEDIDRKNKANSQCKLW